MCVFLPAGESSGLATWAVVVIVVLAAIVLGIVILAILLKLLFAKVAETAVGKKTTYTISSHQ